MENNGSPISLFPMLNILVAVLGVFIYMVISISILALGVGKQVVFVPQHSSKTEVEEQPIYVEWTGTSLILHPSGETTLLADNIEGLGWDRAVNHIGNMIQGTELESVLARVVDPKNNVYIIVVVRPSGFDSFLKFKAFLERNNIEFGYEPIDQSWQFEG